jgi:tRNA-specific 2-thiouridylase
MRGAVLHRGAERVDRVRLRSHAHPLSCRLAASSEAEDEILATLDEPARGVAPGQTASLLDGDLVVGHATIA